MGSESHISVKPKNLPEGRHKAEAEGECFAPFFSISHYFFLFVRPASAASEPGGRGEIFLDFCHFCAFLI